MIDALHESAHTGNAVVLDNYAPFDFRKKIINNKAVTKKFRHSLCYYFMVIRVSAFSYCERSPPSIFI